MEHYATAMVAEGNRVTMACRCGWLGQAAPTMVVTVWQQHRLTMEQAERPGGRVAARSAG